MTSQQMADGLLDEAGVAVLSGTAFGSFGEGYLRLSCANSLAKLETALERMHEFLDGARARVTAPHSRFELSAGVTEGVAPAVTFGWRAHEAAAQDSARFVHGIAVAPHRCSRNCCSRNRCLRSPPEEFVMLLASIVRRALVIACALALLFLECARGHVRHPPERDFGCAGP